MTVLPPSQPFRAVAGGRVDRDRTVRFTFDGTLYRGLKGDTLASALIANGVHLVGRSFKYHRPRGFLSAGSDEPNALVGVGAEEARYTPNLRATQVELKDGLVAVSQNRAPSLTFDVGAVNDLVAPLLPAGFYYKTFMWPQAFWKSVYEPVIRAAAGLGRAPKAPDADRYTQRYAHCDVLVVGSGPAGLAAARAAAASGATVILCDEQAEMGGSLLAEAHATIDGMSRIGVGRGGPRRARRERPRHAAVAHHSLRLVPAQPHRSFRAHHRPSRRPAPRPAARADVAGAREGGGDRRRRHRAADGVPGK